MVASPVAVSVTLAAEQSAEETPTARRIGGLRISGLRILLCRRRLRRGIELRLSLGELFKFTLIQKDASASGALVDFNPKTRDGQHLRSAFGTEHDWLDARTVGWLRHVSFPLRSWCEHHYVILTCAYPHI